jgi:hypothetical protein
VIVLVINKASQIKPPRNPPLNTTCEKNEPPDCVAWLAVSVPNSCAKIITGKKPVRIVKSFLISTTLIVYFKIIIFLSGVNPTEK